MANSAGPHLNRITRIQSDAQKPISKDDLELEGPANNHCRLLKAAASVKYLGPLMLLPLQSHRGRPC